MGVTKNVPAQQKEWSLIPKNASSNPALQIARNPNRGVALGDFDIVLDASHLRRQQNFVAHVVFDVADTLPLLNSFHSNGCRNFHSNNERMQEIQRVIHRHGLGKTRFDEGSDKTGDQRRR